MKLTSKCSHAPTSDGQCPLRNPENKVFNENMEPRQTWICPYHRSVITSHYRGPAFHPARREPSFPAQEHGLSRNTVLL
jgi:hypothetical protein